MKYFDWNVEKNEELKKDRNISFEEIVYYIMHGNLLDTVKNLNSERYQNQKIFIVNVENYVYLVPFVETEEIVFLKTIIPSRKMTKKYLGDDKK